MITFFFMTFILVPAMMMYNPGKGLQDDEKDAVGFQSYSMGNNPPDEVEHGAEGFATDTSEVKNHTVDTPWGEVTPETVSAAHVALDILTCFAFGISLILFNLRMSSVVADVDANSVTASDFAVFVKGMPQKTTNAKHVFDHFNGLYDLSKDDWTHAKGGGGTMCCACISRKQKRPSGENIKDRWGGPAKLQVSERRCTRGHGIGRRARVTR